MSSVLRRFGCLTASAGLAVTAAACSGAGGDQGSPDGVVKALYSDIHDGKFTEACHLVDPASLDALTSFGQTCETAMADHYTAAMRAKYQNIKIDMSDVDTSADVVTIPESAVTFNGRTSTDDDNRVVRKDGKWWAALS